MIRVLFVENLGFAEVTTQIYAEGKFIHFTPRLECASECRSDEEVKELRGAIQDQLLRNQRPVDMTRHRITVLAKVAS